MRFDIVEASSIENAIEQTVYPDGRDKFSAIEGEMAVKEILIVPAENITTVDVKSMAQEIEIERKHQAAEAQKAKELAELKRLQSKYGG